MRTRIMAGTLAAALICLAFASVSGAQAKRGFLGVVYGAGHLPDPDINRMSHGRVGNVRWPLFWANVESAQGQYSWAPVDEIVGDLASRGIRILPAVYSTPPFYASNPAKPPLATKAARHAWARFLRKLVERYGPGGEYWTNPALYINQHGVGAPILPIKAWQIWNEPNLIRYFDTRSPVRKYARLLRIAHAAIKSRDPNARIVLGGLPGFAEPRGWRFLERLYRQRGIKTNFEAAAVHPYSRNVHQFRYEIRRTRDAMDQNGDRKTPLWITEFGWGSAPPDGTFNKGLEGQKHILRRSFELVLDLRRRWNIGRLFWFQWRDPQTPVAGCSLCSFTGLFERNGAPKPAWRAFKHFTGARP